MLDVLILRQQSLILARVVRRGVVNMGQYIVDTASLTRLDATKLMEIAAIMQPIDVSE